MSDALKLGTLGLVAALSRTILAIATLGYIDEDEEPPEESTGGNGGGSGLVSYPQFFQRPAQRHLSHAELVACSQVAGFL